MFLKPRFLFFSLFFLPFGILLTLQELFVYRLQTLSNLEKQQFFQSYVTGLEFDDCDINYKNKGLSYLITLKNPAKGTTKAKELNLEFSRLVPLIFTKTKSKYFDFSLPVNSFINVKEISGDSFSINELVLDAKLTANGSTGRIKLYDLITSFAGKQYNAFVQGDFYSKEYLDLKGEFIASETNTRNSSALVGMHGSFALNENGSVSFTNLEKNFGGKVNALDKIILTLEEDNIILTPIDNTKISIRSINQFLDVKKFVADILPAAINTNYGHIEYIKFNIKDDKEFGIESLLVRGKNLHLFYDNFPVKIQQFELNKSDKCTLFVKGHVLPDVEVKNNALQAINFAGDVLVKEDSLLFDDVALEILGAKLQTKGEIIFVDDSFKYDVVGNFSHANHREFLETITPHVEKAKILKIVPNPAKIHGQLTAKGVLYQPVHLHGHIKMENVDLAFKSDLMHIHGADISFEYDNEQVLNELTISKGQLYDFQIKSAFCKYHSFDEFDFQAQLYLDVDNAKIHLNSDVKFDCGLNLLAKGTVRNDLLEYEITGDVDNSNIELRGFNLLKNANGTIVITGINENDYVANISLSGAMQNQAGENIMHLQNNANLVYTKKGYDYVVDFDMQFAELLENTFIYPKASPYGNASLKGVLDNKELSATFYLSKFKSLELVNKKNAGSAIRLNNMHIDDLYVLFDFVKQNVKTQITHNPIALLFSNINADMITVPNLNLFIKPQGFTNTMDFNVISDFKPLNDKDISALKSLVNNEFAAFKKHESLGDIQYYWNSDIFNVDLESFAIDFGSIEPAAAYLKDYAAEVSIKELKIGKASTLKEVYFVYNPKLKVSVSQIDDKDLEPNLIFNALSHNSQPVIEFLQLDNYINAEQANLRLRLYWHPDDEIFTLKRMQMKFDAINALININSVSKYNSKLLNQFVNLTDHANFTTFFSGQSKLKKKDFINHTVAKKLTGEIELVKNVWFFDKFKLFTPQAIMLVDGNYVPKIDELKLNVKQYYNINASTPWALSIIGGPFFGTVAAVLTSVQKEKLSKEDFIEYLIQGGLKSNVIKFK